MAKAINKVEIGAYNIVHVDKDGTIDVHPTQLENYDCVDTSLGSKVSDLFDHNSNIPFAVVGNLQNDVNFAKPVLPRQSVISLSFSEPQLSVEPTAALRFDTMDPDFELEEHDNNSVGELGVSELVTISISYDAVYVEDQKALQLISYICNVIEDPLLLQL